MRNNMIEPNPKVDRVLERTSDLLRKSLSNKKIDVDALMNSENNMNNDKASFKNEECIKERTSSRHNSHSSKNASQHSNEDFKPKSSLTPFLLLIALSLHGFFEGIALGIQVELEGVFFLAIAIISHKWAEAFTLVKKFYHYFYKIIKLFNYLLIFILGSFI